ncbi:hypothetical protein HFN97_25980 [Rhizobium laguerreae]|uniref:hypothetical protein n=1 Tax=Rhizobium laguerreae TaxID=1076926 RepID=UPI001C903C79|nr:hypothetical protein [Rhizobium laguerreae]MBY3361224.1 hypothetical protein [Rhizobium laguerreae]
MNKAVFFKSITAVALASFIIYFATLNFLSTFRLDDDNLYYLLSGLVSHTPDSFKSTFHTLLSCVQVTENGDTEASFVSRLDLRYNYIWNYTLLSWVWNGVFSVLPHASGTSAFDSAAFIGTFQIAQIMTILAAICLISFGRNSVERLMIFAVAAVVCAALAGMHAGGDRLTTGDRLLSVKFVLSAHQNFNIFNFAPRGLSALLLLAACTWRWQGNYRIFYAVLAVLGFVHQSNATLIVFTFLGMDALFRPRIFTDRLTLVLCGISAACIILREELTQIVGLGVLALVLAAFISLAVASYWLDPFGRAARLLERISIPVPPGSLSDIVIITMTWLGSMSVLKFVMAKGYVDQFSGRYVFFQLHSRYGSLFLAVVIAGIALFIYRLAAKWQWSKAAVCLIVAAAAVVQVGVALYKERPAPESQMIADMQTGLLALNQTTSSYWARPNRLFGRDEEQIFYYSQIALLLGHEIPSMPETACAATAQ